MAVSADAGVVATVVGVAVSAAAGGTVVGVAVGDKAAGVAVGTLVGAMVGVSAPGLDGVADGVTASGGVLAGALVVTVGGVAVAVGGRDALSREIFLLHYWEEMTTVEIAAVLGTPEGTVKTRLRRGREALRQQLRRRGIDPAFAPGDKPGDRPCERPREEAE